MSLDSWRASRSVGSLTFSPWSTAALPAGGSSPLERATLTITPTTTSAATASSGSAALSAREEGGLRVPVGDMRVVGAEPWENVAAACGRPGAAEARISTANVESRGATDAIAIPQARPAQATAGTRQALVVRLADHSAARAAAYGPDRPGAGGAGQLLRVRLLPGLGRGQDGLRAPT